MPFVVLSGLPDVIISAKFCVDRLTGFCGGSTPKSAISLQQFCATVRTVVQPKQEVRTTDNSQPLRPHIQGHLSSLTYPIENLYTRLPITD